MSNVLYPKESGEELKELYTISLVHSFRVSENIDRTEEIIVL